MKPISKLKSLFNNFYFLANANAKKLQPIRINTIFNRRNNSKRNKRNKYYGQILNQKIYLAKSFI